MIDTSFLVGNTPTPLLNKFDIQARRNALALQGQQLQGGAMDLAEKQQALAADQRFRALYSGESPASPVVANALAPAAAAPAGAPAAVAAPAGPAGPGAPAPDWDSFLNPTGPAAGAGPAAAPAPTPAAAAAPAGAPPTAAHQVSDSDILGIFGQRGYALIQARNGALKTQADAQQALATTQALNNEYWGHLYKGLEGVGYDPRAVQGVLSQAAADGKQGTPQFQELAQNANNPQALATIGNARTAMSKEVQTGNAENITANAKQQDANTTALHVAHELPKLDAEGQLAALTAAGKAPIQPAQQIQIDQENRNIAERARHDHADEANARAMREIVTLTPQALDQAATYFATSGQLPSLGMGSSAAGARSAIMNRAAVLYPNLTIASNAANFAANKSSLKNIQGTLDTLSSFEGAGLKNLKQFTDAAAKIPDTGVPWLNTPVRMLDQKLVGSTNMAVVNAARDVALREIARVTNDPKLSGVLSDSARHEVQSLSPENATLPQILAAAKVLQNDMANVHQSLSDQRDAINARIGVTPTSQPAPPAAAAAPAARGVQHMSTPELLKELVK